MGHGTDVTMKVELGGMLARIFGIASIAGMVLDGVRDETTWAET